MHAYICTRLLPRDRAVLRRDMLLLLPEEQLQELPDLLHAGTVLPHLLLPGARCMTGVHLSSPQLGVVTYGCHHGCLYISLEYQNMHVCVLCLSD
jgi:hypothetical protein